MINCKSGIKSTVQEINSLCKTWLRALCQPITARFGSIQLFVCYDGNFWRIDFSTRVTPGILYPAIMVTCTPLFSSLLLCVQHWNSSRDKLFCSRRAVAKSTACMDISATSLQTLNRAKGCMLQGLSKMLRCNGWDLRDPAVSALRTAMIFNNLFFCLHFQC